MKAMLLAAGLGTRLRPLTDRLPKCLVPVAGKPVLQWNIEWLRSQGVTDLVVNLHHYPEVVTGYFGNGHTFGVHLEYSYEPELLGTAGALWGARRFLSTARFWVLYADNLVNCSLERMASLHLARKATLTMGLFWREDVSTSGVVGLNGDGRISGFKEKPAADEVLSHWVNAGILLCEAGIHQFIPPDRASDFGHDILPAMLTAGEPMYGYTLGPEETLLWIDTPDDLALTLSVMQKISPNRQ
ncbi:MAG: nucleotidyltransferase family protein [Deltaproteobacteria bacterium]|nr:MAG: nucleotidyltransferase family protein [Deltaproteobacteria bacterium]